MNQEYRFKGQVNFKVADCQIVLPQDLEAKRAHYCAVPLPAAAKNKRSVSAALSPAAGLRQLPGAHVTCHYANGPSINVNMPAELISGDLQVTAELSIIEFRSVLFRRGGFLLFICGFPSITR